MDLFSFSNEADPDFQRTQPLSERLRPQKLEDMLGQLKFLDAKTPWRQLIESGQLPSLILWGPPGTGKTTFALLVAQKIEGEVVTQNAIDMGSKALRDLGEQAHHRRIQSRRRTVLFIDEIHRLNKAQQDVLLPFIEKGDVLLIGATTENPSYELNAALLSRCRILVFERLSAPDLKTLFERAAELRALTKRCTRFSTATISGTTKKLTSITTPSARSSKACAAQAPTPLFITSRA
jgi:putative ATPase